MKVEMDQSENTSLLDSLSTNFSSISNDFDTLKITVKEDEWVETATKLKDKYARTIWLGCNNNSWISSITANI